MAETLQNMFDEIRMQKENFWEILKTINEGILVLDEKNRIILMNPSAEGYLRLKFADINEQDALSIILVPEIRKLIQGNNAKNIEYQNDESYFSGEIISIPHLHQRLIVIRDISEQHRIQQTKADFVANVSHELRTPLSLIKGYAETMKEEPLSKEQQKYTDIILRHTDRMIALIADLLTLSKIEQSKHIRNEEIMLDLLIEGIMPLFEYKARENKIAIEKKYGSKLALIKGDRSLLEIAISNLIDNAIKYNNPGGKVIIELSSNNGSVILKISDTGIGISQNEQNRIFERFYTVDKAHSHELGGTGLGLAIVKHIVLLHDGEIAVHSTLGEGSVFEMKFHATKSV